ncbi:MAG: PAS domain-containing sensor histidine kinase [Saprospiraceae bacterium]|nr:PAS domain-containing sensor histidine kinase [Saprospiraceae bacterium]
MLSVFALDVWLIDSDSVPFLHVFAVLFGIFFRERNDVVLAAVAATALALGAAVVRQYEGIPLPLHQLMFGRAFTLISIWASAYLVLLIQNMRQEENAQREELQALFQHAASAILIVNQQGQIVQLNPAAEKLFGYSSEGLTGRPIETLIPKRFSRVHERHRDDYRANPRVRAMGTGIDLYALRKDGTEFPVEVSLSPFRTQKGWFVVAFVIDNTLRKENEQRIIRQNHQLEQLAIELQSLNEGLEEKIHQRTQELEQAKNELAAALEAEREIGELKSRFVSMASHEFRTPLSTVLSSAALIKSYAERGDVESIQKHALRIQTAVNNLNTILTEFLSLGRLEEGKTEPHLTEVCLPGLIEESVGEMALLLRPGQTIDYQHEGEEMTRLDAGLFKHVLINLLSNASKYSPEGARIRVHSRVDADETRVRVLDEGVGIPAADQKHLFSRFFRATNATNVQGTGLGLYIVKRYVELMGGEIGFYSEEGKGSEFWVRFPKASHVAERAASA